MCRTVFFTTIVLLTTTRRSQAIITEFLDDEFDGHEAIAMWQHKDVEATHKELDLFNCRLRVLKERDIEALFGKL